MELNRKREGELLKLQRDLEDMQTQSDAQVTASRKKYQEAQNEMAEQVDQLQKAKLRLICFLIFLFCYSEFL